MTLNSSSTNQIVPFHLINAAYHFNENHRKKGLLNLEKACHGNIHPALNKAIRQFIADIRYSSSDTARTAHKINRYIQELLVQGFQFKPAILKEYYDLAQGQTMKAIQSFEVNYAPVGLRYAPFGFQKYGKDLENRYYNFAFKKLLKRLASFNTERQAHHLKINTPEKSNLSVFLESVKNELDEWGRSTPNYSCLSNFRKQFNFSPSHRVLPASDEKIISFRNNLCDLTHLISKQIFHEFQHLPWFEWSERSKKTNNSMLPILLDELKIHADACARMQAINEIFEKSGPEDEPVDLMNATIEKMDRQRMESLIARVPKGNEKENLEMKYELLREINNTKESIVQLLLTRETIKKDIDCLLKMAKAKEAKENFSKIQHEHWILKAKIECNLGKEAREEINKIERIFNLYEPSSKFTKCVPGLSEGDELIFRWIITYKEVYLYRKNDWLGYLIQGPNGESFGKKIGFGNRPIEDVISALSIRREPVVINEKKEVDFSTPPHQVLREWQFRNGDKVELIHKYDTLLWNIFDSAEKTKSQFFVDNDLEYINFYLKNCITEKVFWKKHNESVKEIFENRKITIKDENLARIFFFLKHIPIQHRFDLLSDFDISIVKNTEGHLPSVDLLKKSFPSYLDKNQRIDRDTWAVTLLTAGTSYCTEPSKALKKLGKDAKEVSEDFSKKPLENPKDAISSLFGGSLKIIGGIFQRAAGHSMLVFETVENGSHCVRIAHLLNRGVEWVRENDKSGDNRILNFPKDIIDKFAKEKSETWRRNRSNIQRIIKKIEKEIEMQNDKKMPVNFTFGGKDSFFQIPSYNRETNPHNCATWATDKLKLAGIDLPSGMIKEIITVPKEYTQRNNTFNN